MGINQTSPYDVMLHDINMYLPFQKAAERGGYGDERYEKIEFQKKVGEHYHSLRDSTWKVINQHST